jgi:glyoxalase family protein
MVFEPLASEGARERLAGSATSGTPGRLIDLVDDSATEPARLGAGGVHHISFRVLDLAALEAWRDRLRDLGHRVTDVQNRLYFQSIYVREPGGVLFEFATDGPGVAVDEPEDALGTSLKVPPWMGGGAAR